MLLSYNRHTIQIHDYYYDIYIAQVATRLWNGAANALNQ